MPTCPDSMKKGKRHNMTHKAALGFFECIEVVCDTISHFGIVPDEWGCLKMVPNPKYPEWAKLYAQNMKMRQMGLPPTHRIPPNCPKKIPCPCHYKKQAVGQFNERIIPKRKVLYNSAGMKVVKLLGGG